MELFLLICTVGTSLWLHVHSSVTRSRLIVTLECNKEPDFSSLLHSVHMEPEVCSDCVNVLLCLNEFVIQQMGTITLKCLNFSNKGFPLVYYFMNKPSK